MTEKWTEFKVANALTARGNLFDFRRYSSVPNVRWAILDHGEADLLCLSKGGVFHEVEIKVSKSDLRADRKKYRAHQNRLVSFTWFAVPPELEVVATAELDERFGLVIVEPHAGRLHPNPNRAWLFHDRYQTRVVRRPKKYVGPGSMKPGPKEILRFLRGAAIRLWILRGKVAKREEKRNC